MNGLGADLCLIRATLGATGTPLEWLRAVLHATLYRNGKAWDVRGSAVAVVSSKGQITLPKNVRDALGLEAGTALSFEIQPGQVIVRKEVSEAILGRWRGHLKEQAGGRSTDEVIVEMRGE